MNLHNKRCLFFTLFVFILVSGCQTVYYAAWEKLGKEKRHLLRDQVEKTLSDQEQASEQFTDVLTRIKDMYGFEGGELEKFYNKLNSAFEDCESRADSVRNRISNVEEIAADLFAEWEKEINQIGKPEFRAQSTKSLQDTKKRYERLHKSMVKAEASMDPVLKNLRDYVLFLKHNLNAQAIGSLRREVTDIENEIGTLIKDMTASIAEAEDFLKNFK